MDDLKIGNVLPVSKEGGAQNQTRVHDPISDFKTVLRHSVEEVDHLLKDADQSAQEMVLGKIDIHQAMVVVEQANISFRLMVQVRNKLMAAYEEIMRMQI